MQNYTEIDIARIEDHKRLERYFEVLLYYVIILTLILSYLPIGVFVNHQVVNILALLAFVSGVIGYRFVPVESNGKIIFSFEMKSFIIGSLDVILISFILAATGGAYSPFIFLFTLPIMSAALLLRPKLLYAEMIIFMVSLFVSHFIFFKDFFNYRFIAIILMGLMSYVLSLILINERMKYMEK